MREDCKLTVVFNSKHLSNKNIDTNSTLIIPLEEFIPAAEIKDNIQQMIIDVINYRIEHNEWPKLEPINNEEKDEEW
jgi:hypothetical protein